MWRKEPPSVEDVKQHQWWWSRNTKTDNDPIVNQLDIDFDGIRIIAIGRYDDEPFTPTDWGNEWAPCIPPTE